MNAKAAETIPHVIMMRAIQTRAPTFSRKMLEGTSNRKYPTKNKPAPSPKAASLKPSAWFHVQLGKADINPIEIGHEIAHDQERNKPPHNLADDTFFDVFHRGASRFEIRRP